MSTNQNAVVEQGKASQAPATVTQQTDAVLSIIERAASDPNVDVEKMEKLLDMKERVLAKQAESEFFSALNRCQNQMRRISADCTNNQTRSKYASYGTLDRALRPIYTSEGLSLSFDTEPVEKEDVCRVVCHVSHPTGFTKRYMVDMPADGKGAKGGDVMTKTHATGAAMSYGMRYLLKMIFNVAIGEDDTDGNAPPAQQGRTLNQQQVEQIEEALEDYGVDPGDFLTQARVNTYSEIQQSRFAAAMGWIKKHRGPQS